MISFSLHYCFVCVCVCVCLPVFVYACVWGGAEAINDDGFVFSTYIVIIHLDLT